MKKTKIENFDLYLYEETLNNGLQVKIIPNPNVTSQFATFTTFYGSRIDEFVPIGSKKMKKVPHGIAHFLEHKMFAQPDGKDVMDLFSERGASVNAYTAFDRTVYHFSSNTAFEENLNTLLDFVQNLYITEENVEKEKGIIIQEAKMYLDRPGSRHYYALLDQMFSKDSVRYPGIGSIEDIQSITVEELQMCYDTFYHPSNMMLIISGNVDPDKTLILIKENQSKKKFGVAPKIVEKKYSEPKSVHKKHIVLHMNVKIPKISYNFKIDMRNWDTKKRRIYLTLLSFFFDMHFGSRSILLERLKKQHIISNSLGYSVMNYGDYAVCSIDGETEFPEKCLEILQKELYQAIITKEDFERYKKVAISDIIYASDDIYDINSRFLSQMVHYRQVFVNNIEDIRHFTFSAYQKAMKEISLQEYGTIVLLPQKN